MLDRIWGNEVCAVASDAMDSALAEQEVLLGGSEEEIADDELAVCSLAE